MCGFALRCQLSILCVGSLRFLTVGVVSAAVGGELELHDMDFLEAERSDNYPKSIELPLANCTKTCENDDDCRAIVYKPEKELACKFALCSEER